METRAQRNATRRSSTPELEYLREQALGRSFSSPAVATSPWQSVEPTAVRRASTAWLGLVFVGCYLVLPIVTAMLGLLSYGGLLFGSALGWAVAAALLGRWIERNKPDVRVGSKGAEVPDGHAVGAAFLGHFGVWAVLHTVLPGLLPLYLFGGVGLLVFAAVNMLESALVGAMLGTIVRSPARAFAFGAGFQALVMLIAVMVGA